jgi:hypothetical protein
MTKGTYIAARTGSKYTITSVYSHNGHVIGYVTMSNPATNNGWAGEMSATRWTDLVALDGLRAA